MNINANPILLYIIIQLYYEHSCNFLRKRMINDFPRMGIIRQNNIIQDYKK